MSAPAVVVAGAGVAGAAASFAAARVIVLHDRAGSSALYSGALDGPGGATYRADELGADARAFVDALGIWDLDRSLVATREGVIRRVAGADAALLDLASLAGRRIGVADVERDEWDAPLLAASLSASPWAERTRTSFRSLPVSDIYRGYERRLTAHDFARLHDDPARASALAETLMRAGGGLDAWLVGPWLGTEPNTAPAFRRRMLLPVGETCSAVGGAAGARFEKARDRVLAQSGCTRVAGRLSSVAPRGERWAVSVEATDAERPDLELEASAVVLATGGVAAGGIVLEWEPERGGHGFRLPYTAPAELATAAVESALVGSLFGPPLDQRGLETLEAAGIASDGQGALLVSGELVPGLFVAGDAVAARPRTVLEALTSGVRAGRAAARV